MLALGYPQIEAAFVGAALVSTSVGITAEVLRKRGLLEKRASHVILAAAVIDDILGLIVLAAVSSSAHGHFHGTDVAVTATLASLFVIVLAKWGAPTARRAIPALEARLHASDAQFHVAIVMLFTLSVLALRTGVAAIVGAFLAGMSLSKNVGERSQTLVNGAAELLVPFFLVGVGLKLDLSVFRDPNTLWLAVTMVAVAVVAKLAGCGLAALRLGWRDAARVGAGMLPHGEVGMVVAQLGLATGVVSKNIYAVVVFTAVATTLVAPSLLSVAYRQSELPGV
jgi:Kef-type K+ transport system membrane component KefB